MSMWKVYMILWKYIFFVEKNICFFVCCRKLNKQKTLQWSNNYVYFKKLFDVYFKTITLVKFALFSIYFDYLFDI